MPVVGSQTDGHVRGIYLAKRRLLLPVNRCTYLRKVAALSPWRRAYAADSAIADPQQSLDSPSPFYELRLQSHTLATRAMEISHSTTSSLFLK